jgi:CheY-like chemotaxis protein
MTGPNRDQLATQRRERLTMALQNVLVVDDEPLIRKFLVETLTRMGFETQSAADGAEGLRKVKVETFDLIFTDIKMPHVRARSRR